jgi:hypothetical protein
VIIVLSRKVEANIVWIAGLEEIWNIASVICGLCENNCVNAGGVCAAMLDHSYVFSIPS